MTVNKKEKKKKKQTKKDEWKIVKEEIYRPCRIRGKHLITRNSEFIYVFLGAHHRSTRNVCRDFFCDSVSFINRSMRLRVARTRRGWRGLVGELVFCF